MVNGPLSVASMLVKADHDTVKHNIRNHYARLSRPPGAPKRPVHTTSVAKVMHYGGMLCLNQHAHTSLGLTSDIVVQFRFSNLPQAPTRPPCMGDELANRQHGMCTRVARNWLPWLGMWLPLWLPLWLRYWHEYSCQLTTIANLAQRWLA